MFDPFIGKSRICLCGLNVLLDECVTWVDGDISLCEVTALKEIV
jgi:hypothetical protein